jgi:hypothetical protein
MAHYLIVKLGMNYYENLGNTKATLQVYFSSFIFCNLKTLSISGLYEVGDVMNEYGAVGGMRIGWGKLQRKPAPVPCCLSTTDPT